MNGQVFDAGSVAGKKMLSKLKKTLVPPPLTYEGVGGNCTCYQFLSISHYHSGERDETT